MRGFALGLGLKRRLRATRKWTIKCGCQRFALKNYLTRSKETRVCDENGRE